MVEQLFPDRAGLVELLEDDALLLAGIVDRDIAPPAAAVDGLRGLLDLVVGGVAGSDLRGRQRAFEDQVPVQVEQILFHVGGGRGRSVTCSFRSSSSEAHAPCGAIVRCGWGGLRALPSTGTARLKSAKGLSEGRSKQWRLVSGPTTDAARSSRFTAYPGWALLEAHDVSPADPGGLFPLRSRYVQPQLRSLSIPHSQLSRYRQPRKAYEPGRRAVRQSDGMAGCTCIGEVCFGANLTPLIH